MYDENDGTLEKDDDQEDLGDISQEDCWTVINSFFQEKGLVRQQLDSFDEFVQNTMQEIVDENRHLVLQTTQGSGNEGDLAVCIPFCHE
jgi:DNA-directed RNA polymerase II subunit RPB2